AADLMEGASMAGPARDWLAANRGALNGRFRLLQRRYPALSPEPVLLMCRELLSGVAGQGEEGTAELLGTVYDLILLHARRGTLAPGGGSQPGIRVLLGKTAVRIRRLLLPQPRRLLGALSNAVENLGARGVEFASGIADLADVLKPGDDLLDAGAVLAW